MGTGGETVFATEIVQSLNMLGVWGRYKISEISEYSVFFSVLRFCVLTF